MSFRRSIFSTDPFFKPFEFSPFYDPFDEMEREFERKLRWIRRPQFSSLDFPKFDFPKMDFPKLDFPRLGSSPKPEKYRITVDISGYNSNSVKTDVSGNKVLVTAREENRENPDNYSIKEFKKSYELPANAIAEQLSSFVSSTGKLCIEVPLKSEKAQNTTSSEFPSVNDDGKSVSLSFNLPERVDPSKINVSCKDNEVIVRAEDKFEDKNTQSSFSFYQSTTLPRNTDLNAIKCTLNGTKLNLNAPLLASVKDTHRQIPIEHVKN